MMGFRLFRVAFCPKVHYGEPKNHTFLLEIYHLIVCHNFLIFELTEHIHIPKLGKIFQGIHFSQLWSHQSTWVGNTTTIAFSALFVQKIAESAVAPAAAMGELQQFEKRIPREILPHFDR